MDENTHEFFPLGEAVELVEKKDFFALRNLLAEAEPADIATLFEEIPKEQFPVVFRILPKETAAETFVEMDSDMQELLISSFSDVELKGILDELYIDDTVDIIEEMPANVVTRILANADKETRNSINELLRYPDDSAGSIMTTEYVALKENMTVSDAFDHIRKVGIDKETIYTCYVTNNRHLVGVVTAKMLLLSDKGAKIGDIMDKNVISAKTTDDKEDVAAMFKKYGFLALPVVDNDNRLVGIVTVDDAIDVIHEETEEDFAKMAAITPSDKSYLKTSAVTIWLTRIPWLMILMISATFTGMIITSFEEALAAQVALTAFIPMLMDTGGNSGSQASVTIIRGLSTGEIRFSDIAAVIWKEFRVSIMCGVSLAVVNFVKILLVDNLLLGSDISIPVIAVISITMLLTVVIAKFFGCTLPILAKRIGLDPAVMASPFITTIVDATSLLIYFRVASLILKI